MNDTYVVDAGIYPIDGKWYGKVSVTRGRRMWDFETPDEEKVKTVKDHIRFLCHKMGWSAKGIEVREVKDMVRKS